MEREQISVDFPEGTGDLEFSPDGNLLAVATRVGAIKLWDLKKIRAELAKLELDW